jgi:hypothetical protein
LTTVILGKHYQSRTIQAKHIRLLDHYIVRRSPGGILQAFWLVDVTHNPGNLRDASVKRPGVIALRSCICLRIPLPTQVVRITILL